jgi:hypothetical protein
MSECNKEEKLWIAKAIYLELKSIIDRYENTPGVFINCHWDEFISVEDEFFTEEDLKSPGMNYAGIGQAKPIVFLLSNRITTLIPGLYYEREEDKDVE